MENSGYEPQPTESELIPEPVDTLLEKLNFLPTLELNERRTALIGAMSTGTPEDVQAEGARFYEEAEKIMNQQEGEAYARAQVGILLAVALVRRDAGRVAAYVDSLEDALAYAKGMGYNDIVPQLRAAIVESLPTNDAAGDAEAT